ncbi:MAG: hypothetical protein DRH50_01535 [Deltaproteobacteria bacterium]|nr:MAG: hypothetical protein DRH50_01535 [Deltaproteobacteria bacterium]
MILRKLKGITPALSKNRHTERIGHPIGDRLKLEPLPAGRQVTERKEKTALRSSNKIHSVTISVIVKGEYSPYCFFSTLTNALRQ